MEIAGPGAVGSGTGDGIAVDVTPRRVVAPGVIDAGQ